MIDHKELRVGNYIYQDFGQDKMVIVGSSDIISIEKSPIFYNPIPLTEEWLLKLGFAHGYFGIDRGKLSIITKGMNGYKNGRTYFNSLCILDRQPKYVHQLQNLYFALTGKELVIITTV